MFQLVPERAERIEEVTKAGEGVTLSFGIWEGMAGGD